MTPADQPKNGLLEIVQRVMPEDRYYGSMWASARDRLIDEFEKARHQDKETIKALVEELENLLQFVCCNGNDKRLLLRRKMRRYVYGIHRQGKGYKPHHAT